MKAYAADESDGKDTLVSRTRPMKQMGKASSSVTTIVCIIIILRL